MPNDSAPSNVGSFFVGDAGSAQNSEGITTRAFLLNLAVGFALFAVELTIFFLLKSSNIGRRIFQPKTFLVQERLRVETIPVSPIKWISRIFTIKDEDIKAKCGLDGYFFIRFIRTMLTIFIPLMCFLVTILLPVNYNGGRNNNAFHIKGHKKPQTYNIKGLDTLSWQNVAPTETDRYWAHLVCALLAISWTLYRIYREKLHYIQVRQQYLTSPEHRLRASARTLLVTNIPNEYQGNEALEALFDVFVDNDDRSKLHVWVNRDYGPLRTKVMRLRSLRGALEKEELKFLRAVNKGYQKGARVEADGEPGEPRPVTAVSDADEEDKVAQNQIAAAFKADEQENEQRRQQYPKMPKQSQVKIVDDGQGWWKPASKFKSGGKVVTKAVWLRADIAHLTIEVEEMLRDLDNESRFKRQNSAFIQFNRQMSANMAVGLVSHEKPGCMTPRFLDVAPHEIIWKNMGLTSRERFIRICMALLLFVGIAILWGIPATFLGILSQLSQLRNTTSYLHWLKSWPDWIISLISGPVVAILLALLIQLVVPALCRKLAVLVGCPTRSRREIVTQRFYFAFLFIELVLVTSISSGIFATISNIINNPTTITTTLATDLPKAANYFFNYLVIQALGFSGSVLCQYLRLLYITTIWPWFTQTPRQEAWLQTTIPHQMWGNVYPMFTNFAAIGLIYCVTAPLMLVFASAVFCLFWIAYRHNYYFVQRNKVDTHGMLFNQALSQIMAGVYVLEITLIGLFFLVRNEKNSVSCKGQAIVMIVALVLTAAYHYILESALSPLYELVPVTLEDKAVEKEKKRFGAEVREMVNDDEAGGRSTSNSIERSGPGSDSEQEKSEPARHEGPTIEQHDGIGDLLHTTSRSSSDSTPLAKAAANARRTFQRLNNTVAARVAVDQSHHGPRRTGASRKLEVQDQLGETIADYPDELPRLTPRERDAELSTAYQDPVTREPAPVIWIPQDEAGVSEEKIKEARKYGRYLQYNNSGAYLTKTNKCEITQPAPDSRPDWMLDWSL